jgi:hypothetical protein
MKGKLKTRVGDLPEGAVIDDMKGSVWILVKAVRISAGVADQNKTLLRHALLRGKGDGTFRLAHGLKGRLGEIIILDPEMPVKRLVGKDKADALRG